MVGETAVARLGRRPHTIAAKTVSKDVLVMSARRMICNPRRDYAGNQFGLAFSR